MLLSVLAGVVSAVLALPLGPWIEHHHKLPVMVATDLLRFIVIVSVPVAAYLGVLKYWQLCMVAIVQMAARLAFDSASVAQLRTLVPPASSGGGQRPVRDHLVDREHGRAATERSRRRRCGGGFLY
jgi:hypothetical protein